VGEKLSVNRQVPPTPLNVMGKLKAWPFEVMVFTPLVLANVVMLVLTAVTIEVLPAPIVRLP